MTPELASSFAAAYTRDVARVIESLPLAEIAAALALLEDAHRDDAQVFVIGNGGSAATASHMANDLTWGLTRAGIRPLRAIALTDNVALMTAIANDASYDEVFSRQLAVLARPGDLLIAFSASGNSPNVLRAVELARSLRLKTVGILGMTGGRAAELVDVKVVVPASEYGPIEDAHLVFDHLALSYLRQSLKA
jgi:D-sedoheptulose 7-phosphate isomerase